MNPDDMGMIPASDAQDIQFSNVDITDRYMFAYVMRNQEVCQELLQYIFPEHKIDRISYREHNLSADQQPLPAVGQSQVEKTIATNFGKHGVRLDVYLDGGDEVYEVEMQTSPQRYLGKRAQFYSAQLTIEQLPRGIEYETLRPSYVIFICKFDPFGEGLYRYSFRHTCHEAEVELGDGAHIVFLNTTGTKGEISDGMREILQYMNDVKSFPVRETDVPLIQKIERIVTEAKADDDWRRNYRMFASYMRDVQLEAKAEGRAEGEAIGEARGLAKGEAIGRAEGRAEGEAKGKILGAIGTYLDMGFSEDQIKTNIIKRFNLSEADATRYMATPEQQ